MKKYVLLTLVALFAILNVQAQDSFTLRSTSAYTIIDGVASVEKEITYYFVFTEDAVAIYDENYELEATEYVREVKEISDTEFHFHITSIYGKWTTEIVIDLDQDAIYYKQDGDMIVFSDLISI
jgi:hypothetical protein